MSELRNLPITQLHPNPWNRTLFNPQKLEELAASIKAEGVREPLKVRPVHKSPSLEKRDGEMSRNLEPLYEIASGHRRWLAAQKAGLKELPCIIESMSDEQVAKDNVVLNVQREDVPILELSKMAKGYMAQFKKNQTDTATAFGLTQGRISQLLSYLEIDPGVRQIISRLIIPDGGYLALRALNPDLQRQVAQELQNGTLKPEQTEKRCIQLRQTQSVTQAKKKQPTNTEDPVAWLWPKVADQVDTAWKVSYQNKGWTLRIENQGLMPTWVLKELFLKLSDALGDTEKEKADLSKSFQQTADWVEQIMKKEDTETPAERAAAEKAAEDAIKEIEAGMKNKKAAERPVEPMSEAEQIRMANEIAKKYGRIG